MEYEEASPRPPLAICSTSDKADIQPGAAADWRFHAITDDGGAALVITFYEDFPLGRRPSNGQSPGRCPAVALTYTVGRNVRIRTTNQFSVPPSSNEERNQFVEAGASEFHVEKTGYGNGVVINVNMPNVRGGRVIAHLEWLFVESDLLAPLRPQPRSGVVNLVSPRSDVTGRLTCVEKSGRIREVIHFRGTGYHDQISYISPERPSKSCLAHVHLGCATVILIMDDSNASLCTVQDDQIVIEDIHVHTSVTTRNSYGFDYPKYISGRTAGGNEIDVKNLTNIDAGFFNLKMFCEMKFGSRDGTSKEGIGMVEFSQHERAKRRLFQRLSGLRVGRNGRPPIF